MDRRNLLKGASSLALIAAASSAASAEERRLRVVARGVVYGGGPGIIAGNARAANGDLLVAFNTGGDLSAGQRVGIVRSRDEGRTWSSVETWFDSVFKRGGIEAG